MVPDVYWIWAGSPGCTGGRVTAAGVSAEAPWSGEAPWSEEAESPDATNVSQPLSGMASRRSGRPARRPSTALAMSKPR